jgi:hypothetical protein
LKTTEETFKNIQVLKGIPADQLFPAMQFMASSLGVGCNYCHVEGHFEKDDKKQKETARKMVRMMFEINQSSFGGLREVTCNSCHRGAPKPVDAPVIANEAKPAMGSSGSLGQNSSTNLPTAQQLIDNYIQALGGTAAIQKASSRVERGVTNISGKPFRVEIFTQGPDKWALVRHLPQGDAVSIFDGHTGWVGTPGRPAREMHGTDLEAARIGADLQFPLRIQRVFPDLREEYPEKIGDREAYVLSGMREGRRAVKLYFDQESGLLTRLMLFAESPLGVNPLQIDYGAYREVDAVKVPLRITFTEPGSVSMIEIEDVQQNVPIDVIKFAKPSSPVGPSSSSGPH